MFPPRVHCASLPPGGDLVQAQEIRQTLRSGGSVYGFMLSAIGVPRWGASLGGSTIDYAVIDSEHAPRDRKEIQELCAMLRQAGIAPIVRVPAPMQVYV